MTEENKKDDGKETALVPADVGFMTPPKEGERALTKFERMQLQNAKQQLSEIVAGQALQAKLVDLALRVTDEGDWDDMGAKRGKNSQGRWETIPYSGTPRLNARGAKKVRRIAMLQVEVNSAVMIESEKDEETGELTYYCYEAKGRVTSPWGPPMDCVGRCDSNNLFHSTRGYGKDRRKLKASEVSRVNIAQQAHTLCITRGITQYLGLEKLTWDEVRNYTSVDPNAAPRTAATFNQPQDKPDTPPPPEDGPPPQDPPPPEGVSMSLVTAIKKFGFDAGVVRDAVGWWSIVTETVGSVYALHEGQTEAEAYAKWTPEIATKVKNEIAKRSNEAQKPAE